MMQLYICIPGIWLIWWWDDATLIFLLQTPNNIEDLLPEIPLPFPVGKQIIRNAECRRENIKETSICKVGDQFITVPIHLLRINNVEDFVIFLPFKVLIIFNFLNNRNEKHF